MSADDVSSEVRELLNVFANVCGVDQWSLGAEKGPGWADSRPTEGRYRTANKGEVVGHVPDRDQTVVQSVALDSLRDCGRDAKLLNLTAYDRNAWLPRAATDGAHVGRFLDARSGLDDEPGVGMKIHPVRSPPVHRCAAAPTLGAYFPDGIQERGRMCAFALAAEVAAKLEAIARPLVTTFWNGSGGPHDVHVDVGADIMSTFFLSLLEA